MSRAPIGTFEHSTDEAFIVVKAAPRTSSTYGETVCIAAIDRNGAWVRLYPVSFRQLGDAKKFGRWDRISYRWRRPRAAADQRSESRRVDQNSIEIVGRLADKDRRAFLNRACVTSLKRERESNRSLALLSIEVIEFWYERQSDEELARQTKAIDDLRRQTDMFAIANSLPREACPYQFKYHYRDEDGSHEGTWQDWETEATFFKRRSELCSEQAALDWMINKFGVELPRKGIALAMGTHRRRADQWLINGIIQLPVSTQQARLNLL